jgi:hypothetical protein
VVIDADQRSDAWRLARAGRLTGSRAADAIDFLKGGKESAKRRDYKYQLVAEQLCGTPEENGYVNDAMLRGIEKEPEALGAYEVLTGNLARTSGFLSHTSILAGCSLDAHVGAFEGILEIKCPKTATHLKYLRAGVVPEDYRPQMVHNLWISEANWCDFLSFDDRLPENMRTFLVRLERDEKAIAAYAAQAEQFLAEVALEVNSLRGWSVLSGAA